MSVRTVVRLRCEGCGRNLADVRCNTAAHISHGLRVVVTARPGVDVTEYLPENSLDLTYSMLCRCGHQHDRREDRLREYWRENAARPSARVLYATVGRDV